MVRTKYRYILLLIVLAISCQRDNTKKDDYQSLTSSAKNKFKNMRSIISHLNLKSTINEIVTEKSVSNIRYIYYFKSSDCFNCVQQGFKSLEKTSLNKNDVVVIISPLNYKKYQRYSDYMTHYTVLIDSLDLFRKKTHNAYSPMFMAVDSQTNVKSTFQFFGLVDDLNRFIKYLNTDII